MQNDDGIRDGTFEYYAFISYSHKDKPFAKWLQKALERSRIPAGLHRENDDIVKKIAPVFRDDTDLVNHTTVSRDLRGELERSRFLILLCSPASAKSEWVNDEVKTFISLGRIDNIIPVILSGKPKSGDPETECFPPALLELDRESEQLGISVQEHGRRGAFLRVVASLLDIRLNQIIDRDRRIRRRMRAVRIFCGAFLALATAFLLWYNVPVKSYYRDYTCQWDLPVGLERLSAAERKCRGVNYRFTSRRGRVISVERVNASGVPVEADVAQLWTEPSVIRFNYEDIGLFGKKSLSSKEYYGIGGKKLLSLQYSIADGSNTRAVDLVAPDLSSSAVGAGAYSTDLSLFSGGDVSDLGRFIDADVAYDENGYMLTRMYMRDNWNHPVCDADGIYGLQYRYTADGRVSAVFMLDESGHVFEQDTGIAGELYRYDGSGNLTESVRVNAAEEPVIHNSSYVYQRCTFDRYGRSEELRAYDAEQQPMASADLLNAAGIRTSYDGAGNAVSTVFLDEAGRPALNLGGYAEIRRQYDENGRMTEERYLDLNGETVACADGIASRTYEYDPEGNVTLYAFFDVAGVPVRDPGLDCCSVALHYDEGRIVKEEYFDETGAACMTAGGFAGKERVYNEAGQMTRIAFLDQDGAPILAETGAGYVEMEYKESSLYRLCYFGLDGEPVSNCYGYSVCQFDREEGLLTGVSYWDAQGQPAVPYRDCWSREEITYDEFARMTGERFYDMKGEPVLTNGGYAAVKYDWDTASGAFRLYYDADGQETDPDPAEAERNAAQVILICVIGFAQPDSPAEAAGMRQADIILDYNGWSYADCYTDHNRTIETFMAAGEQARETEKSVTVTRPDGNGSWQKQTLQLPEGMAGYIYSGYYASVGFVERFLLGNAPA